LWEDSHFRNQIISCQQRWQTHCWVHPHELLFRWLTDCCWCCWHNFRSSFVSVFFLRPKIQEIFLRSSRCSVWDRVYLENEHILPCILVLLSRVLYLRLLEDGLQRRLFPSRIALPKDFQMVLINSRAKRANQFKARGSFSF